MHGSGTFLEGCPYREMLRSRKWESTDLALEERLRFERLLANPSATFVNVPSGRLDEMINSSLKTLVEFLGDDRSTLARVNEDKAHALVTYSYAVPEYEPFPLGAIADDRLPWYTDTSGSFVAGKPFS